MKKKELPEIFIEDLIITWLNYQPETHAFKLPIKASYNPKFKCRMNLPKNVPRGGADILCCKKGRFIAIEVKTPRAFAKAMRSPGEHEKRQFEFLSRISASQGFAMMACSLEQVQEHIKTFNL